MNINRNNGDILNDAAYAQGTMDNNVRLSEVQNMFANEVAILHKKMETAYPANSAVHNALVGGATELFRNEMSELRQQIERTGIDGITTSQKSVNASQKIFLSEMDTLRKYVAKISKEAATANKNSLDKAVATMKSEVDTLKKTITASVKVQDNCQIDISKLTTMLQKSKVDNELVCHKVVTLHKELVSCTESSHDQMVAIHDGIDKDLKKMRENNLLVQGSVNKLQRTADSNEANLKVINEAIDNKFAKLFPEKHRWFPTFRKLFKR